MILSAYTFDVEVQDVLEVLRQTGEQRVVAPVAGKVRHAQCVKRETFGKRQPRNTSSALKQHKLFNVFNSLRAQVLQLFTSTPYFSLIHSGQSGHVKQGTHLTKSGWSKPHTHSTLN